MKKTGSVIVPLKALLCLCCQNWFFDELIKLDKKKEPAADKEAMRQLTIEQRDSLRKALFQSFSLIFVASILGWGLWWISSVCNLDIVGVRKVFSWVSVFMLSWATLARLSLVDKTFAGDTVFEQLDEFIFKFLYFIGTFLVTFSIFAG